ncbi:MAG: vitamin K epoxide reductase family protein [Gemmatimonadota bacterium]
MRARTFFSRIGLERKGLSPARLRDEIRDSGGEHARRRRWIVALSALGAVDFAVISLYQTGVIRHLPDPPLPGFASDEVNAAEDAYAMGFPDGPLGMTSYAAGAWLASIGGERRAQDAPQWPLLLAVKAAADMAGAVHYLKNMATVQRKACLYCLIGAGVNFAVLGLALPEARHAAAGLLRR